MPSEGTHLFTSESVTEGHPDKMADQISDAVLDAVLAKDSQARVACETLVTTGLVFVTGEISTEAHFKVEEIVRDVVREIGYDDATYGFDADTCAVISSLTQQSPDIAMGVDTGGAGDQGMMFGYACNETPELMPMPIMLSHRLSRRLTAVRRDGTLDYLRPDGKSQVTVKYDGSQPFHVSTVVLSSQHAPDVTMDQLTDDLMEHVVKPVVPEELLGDDTEFHINPTGRFVVGGPVGDAGLTGRKIIVDTYGGVGRHGGGAFSGKDPTKVDRSATYMARYIAKNLVAAELAARCEVQLAFAIGVAEPVSVMVETFGTGKVPQSRLEELVREHFGLTPQEIISHLKLRRPIFRKTAAYGHFGRIDDDDFAWEKTDKADELRDAAGLQ